MAKDTADSASQLVDRLLNDAPFRESVAAAPTIHDKAQLLRAAGYGDVSLDAIQAAMKEQLATLGAGVQVDPARAKRTEELFFKAASDPELQQALQAAATPEAKRDVLAHAGYGDITLDDLKAAAADLAQREELSDAELEQVSGGAWDPTAPTTWAIIGSAAGAGAAVGATIGGPVGALWGAGIGLATSILTAVSAPPVSDW